MPTPAVPIQRPKSGGASRTFMASAAAVRPRSAAGAGSGARFRGRAGGATVLLALDSESSDDEEREVRDFWKNLRQMRAEKARSQYNWSAPDPPRIFRAARPSPCDDRRREADGGRSPRGAPPPPQPAKPQRVPLVCPPSPSRSAAARRALGGPLWTSLAGLSLEILCFLTTESIGRLASAAPALQSLCSVAAPGGRQGRRLLVAPHGKLTSEKCESWVQQVDLAHVFWIEARDLNPKGSRALLAGLESRGPGSAKALLTLDLRNTRLQGSAHFVVAVLRACLNLRSLNLGRTRLRDEGAEILASGLLAEDSETRLLRAHPRLQTLCLEECGLTKVSGPMLVAAALAMPRLEELVLGRNEIGDETALAIARALSPLGPCTGGASLTRLDLSENLLTGEGLAELAGALASHGYLQSLDVGGNERIGGVMDSKTECAQQVAEGLNSAAALRDLHLWRCGLYDESATLLVDSLPPRLRLLNIAANPFSRELRRKLVRLRGSGGACSIRA